MSNISVDYDVLNQKGSPAWYSDVYANIPTAGYKGRMFISTDTYAFYRDTGTGWDLIGGPGSGTLTGSGVAGQVSYFNGTQTITGNNNLFWDSTNNRLGIGTITPGQSLDIHSTGNTLVQLNNTSTGNSNISFQNQDVAKWRVGNVYNAGANSFNIQNAGLSTNAISISSTTNNVNFGSTIGNGTFTYTLPGATGTLALTSNLSSYLPLAGGTMSGNLVRTTAPRTTTLSETGLDFQGIGGSVSILNLNNTADAGNTLVKAGANSPYVSSILVTANFADITNPNANPGTIIFTTASTERMRITNAGNVGIGTSSPVDLLTLNATLTSTVFTLQNGAVTKGLLGISYAVSDLIINSASGDLNIRSNNTNINFSTNNGGTLGMRITSGGNLLIGTTSDNGVKLQVSGSATIGNTSVINTMTISTLGNFQTSYLQTLTSASAGPTYTYMCDWYFSGSSGNWSSGTGQQFLRCRDDQNRLIIYESGNIQNTNNSYGSLSDIKIKENIIDSTPKLDDILKVRIVNYNKIGDKTKQIGVIAQELEQIFPSMVEEFFDTIDIDNKVVMLDTKTKAVKYSVFVPILIKAIQELNDKLVKNNIN